MKRNTWFAILFVLFFIGTALTGRSSAPDIIEVSATETYDPRGLFGPPVGRVLSLPTVTCPGNEPTGNPLQPCPVDSLLHFRGFKLEARLDSLDPRLSGKVIAVVNGNLDAEFTGPEWGTFSIALDAGGIWDGTLEGRRVKEGNRWVIAFHVSGQGTGGAVDAMQLMLVDRVVMLFPVPIAYTGTLEGRIVDPNSN